MNKEKTKALFRFRWLVFFILSLAYFFVYFVSIGGGE